MRKLLSPWPMPGRLSMVQASRLPRVRIGEDVRPAMIDRRARADAWRVLGAILVRVLVVALAVTLLTWCPL